MNKDISKYIIEDSFTIRETMVALNNLPGSPITLFVLNHSKKLVGTVTDGDIRRRLIEGIHIDESVTLVMNSNYHYITNKNINVRSIKQLKEKGISLVPVLSSEKEIINIYNLKINKSILPIDVVLMAGGKGERLRPLTERTPKPLIKIGEKCIIDYNVDALIKYGVENINVTVNYLKEQIEGHFSNPRENIQVKCIREPKFLGTMGAVKFIPNFENETILVMNSDLFTNVDYEDFYLHFIDNNADISVLSIPYSYNIPYGIFELDGRNIKRIREKPTYNYFANGGIYLIKKHVLDLIPEGIFFNATDLIDIAIEKGFNVIRFPLTGYWIDIGKHEDYKKAQELVKHIYGK